MNKLVRIFPILFVCAFALQSCNGGAGTEMEETDLVPSGTYTGEAHKVDPEEKEIYLKTEDGKTLELYLTDATKLTKNGESVEFSALKTGQQLEVEVEKKGKRLDPLAVKIIE